ncbi:hypothetical protein FB451DRAFT_1194465 [Mycena latifolia]|nr:hypothetical protein FB451DRAFT_1194465 [Mycena latifolia]
MVAEVGRSAQNRAIINFIRTAEIEKRCGGRLPLPEKTRYIELLEESYDSLRAPPCLPGELHDYATYWQFISRQILHARNYSPPLTKSSSPAFAFITALQHWFESPANPDTMPLRLADLRAGGQNDARPNLKRLIPFPCSSATPIRATITTISVSPGTITLLNILLYPSAGAPAGSTPALIEWNAQDAYSPRRDLWRVHLQVCNAAGMASSHSAAEGLQVFKIDFTSGHPHRLVSGWLAPVDYPRNKHRSWEGFFRALLGFVLIFAALLRTTHLKPPYYGSAT